MDQQTAATVKKQAAIRFDTSAYEASHGRRPRGTGSWAFGPERYTDIDSDQMFWSHQTSYTTACSQARVFYAVKNISLVYVQS